MKFIIMKRRRTWVMNLSPTVTESDREWDALISKCAIELMTIDGNVRMSYSEWVFNEDKIEDLKQFITYFTLKYV